MAAINTGVLIQLIGIREARLGRAMEAGVALSV